MFLHRWEDFSQNQFTFIFHNRPIQYIYVHFRPTGQVINTKKMSCFCTDGKISVRINLPLFSTVVTAIIIAGTTVENKGKLIITIVFIPTYFPVIATTNQIFYSAHCKNNIDNHYEGDYSHPFIYLPPHPFCNTFQKLLSLLFNVPQSFPEFCASVFAKFIDT